MKVYVLIWRDWDDVVIDSVYASESAAEQGKAQALLQHKDISPEEYEIKEYEVED